MTLLSESLPFTDILKFLKVLLWICLPFFSVALLVTTLFHYWKKWKQKSNDEEVPVPEFLIYAVPGEIHPHVLTFTGSYLSSLAEMRIAEFSQPSSVNGTHGLTGDFSASVENRNFLPEANQQNITSKIESMNKIEMEIQQTLQEQIDQLKEKHTTEKIALEMRIEELISKTRELEMDNSDLRKQVVAFTASAVEKNMKAERQEEDIHALKSRLLEQGYLQDILEEKKTQIDFLQNQLEQRIKNYHLLEQQSGEMNTVLSEMKEKLDARQNSEEYFQSLVREKQQENLSLQEIIFSKDEHIIELENTILELQNKNAEMQSLLEKKSEMISQLRNQQFSDAERLKQLEEKLQQDKHFFRKFYAELAEALEQDQDIKSEIQLKQFEPSELNEELYTEPVEQ